MSILFHCSSLHKLVGKDKSGTGLSETAKSHVKECVLRELYGYSDFQGNKYTEKGNECEAEAISVIAELNNDWYVKHEGRVTNQWLSGECDILTAAKIHDVKCAWSIGTFPWFDGEAEDAIKKAGYAWQGAGYMMLYDRPEFDLHYVLLPTPEHLIKFGDSFEMLIDKVLEIPIEKRVRTVNFKRDPEKEALIIERVTLAQEYAAELISQLTR